MRLMHFNNICEKFSKDLVHNKVFRYFRHRNGSQAEVILPNSDPLSCFLAKRDKHYPIWVVASPVNLFCKCAFLFSVHFLLPKRKKNMMF